jgi:Putative MetA-pathway of phenol degradation
MKKRYLAAAVGFQSLCMMTLAPQTSYANNITFAVIAPHEYELPVEYDDFSVFVQYNQINSSGKFYNDNGDLVNVPGKQNLYVGLSKYVYFTTFDAMPGVGWAFEAIVPEVHIGIHDAPNLNGVGDPIFGFATWIKPTPNSTLGVQSFLQPPIGSKEVSNNFWTNLSSVLFDIQFERISFVGDVGVVIPFAEEDRKLFGLRPGDSFHTNLRWGYKLNDPNQQVRAPRWQ